MTLIDLPTKCKQCGTTLVRITKPESDQVFCPTCEAVRNYKEIIEDALAGLIGGILTPEEIIDLRKNLRLAGK